MSAELERETLVPRPFSISRGPYLRLLHRVRLTRSKDGPPRAWLLALIAWGPLMLGGLIRVAAGHRPPPILLDLSVHTRLVIGVPLLILAEQILDRRCQSAVYQLYDGGFVERAALDPIFDRVERLRDAHRIELALFMLTVFGGQALLWGVVDPTGAVAGIARESEITFARLWYVVVAWPLFQFLLLRWIWHWLLWTYIVLRLSRLPLATIATHPDQAAGLGFLRGPINGFAGFVLALATMLASAWGTQVLERGTSVQAFVPSFISFAVLAVVVAVAPLLSFVRMLYRARYRELARYDALALDYVRRFDRKWVESRPSEELLGTPDVRSLDDLGGAVERLDKTRLVPFGPRSILIIWIAAVIPMLPLLATTMPLDELVEHVGRAVLGGLP